MYAKTSKRKKARITVERGESRRKDKIECG